MGRVIVPISLGGSEHQGIFCPPIQEYPMEHSIPELIQSYKDRLGRVDEVGFFHGGVLSPKLISYCDGLNWRLSVHPLDCSRENAIRYIEGGMKTIELEALSLCDDVLFACKRGYTLSYIQQQVSFFQKKNIQVGMVLSPGLERSSFGHGIRTVEHCIALGINFVRIYPVCVYRGTKLEQWYNEGRFSPLKLSEAVTIIREMMDLLSEAKIEVIRVGRQHSHDGLVEAIAGPIHSNIRSLVEYRRFFDKISAQLCGQYEEVTHIIVHPKDVSLAKGVQGSTLRHLRARLGRDLILDVDKSVPRGKVLTRRKDE